MYVCMNVCKEHLCPRRQPYSLDCHGLAMRMYQPTKKPRKAFDGHRRQHARLLAAYLQSQSQRDLDLNLGSGQGHINMHNTCRTTSTPNHLTVASRTTEIWLFEFREISTSREVGTLVIAFLEGNSKIGLRQALGQVSYYHYQPSVLSSARKWRRR